jgi:hypothetical protein
VSFVLTSRPTKQAILFNINKLKEPEQIMKSQRLKRIVKTLAVAIISTAYLVMLPGMSNAKQPGPPFSFPGGKRGQQAIDTLRERLPEVASRYGKSAKKLKKTLLHDKDLWLDPADNLLYLCSFDISEADALPEPAESAIPTGPFPLSQTFQLHSQPGASKVIYLDFDGHTTSGTIWNSNFNGGADIIAIPYDFDGKNASFSDTELSRIQNIWARVAEDFAMYDIDVTTEDPGIEALRRSGSGDNFYGIRVVITPTSSWYGSAGGVAYIGSFDWTSDTPTFVFSNILGNGNENYVSEAIAHETGHTLGLVHDGTTSGTTYYAGHGNWAPIMGNSYYKAVTQWSKGEYAGANNTEDDLAVMLNNGASYRTDDHGDWIDSATMLRGDILDGNGIIERTGDMDVFGFQTDAGNILINVDPANLDPNLDILVQVLDDGGNIMGEDGQLNILPASLNLNLPAGTYYISIDGAGTGNPDTGYTDYASLGQYFISGQLPTSQFPPDAPSNLTATTNSASQINLNWTDNSSNENGFTIERSLTGTDQWIEVGFVSGNIATYMDTGLIPSTTYYYRVSAYNVIGSSSFTNLAEATTFELPPIAPSNLNAAAVSTEQIDLNWTDNAANEIGFTVERSANGVDNWTEVGFSDANITSYSDTELVSGTTYHYRVAAYNLNGSSGFSNTANATTDEVVPGAPTNLVATSNFSNQVDLNWTDTANNENVFTIERSPNGLDSWLEIDQVAANNTSYSDIALASGTTYYYRIAAVNSAGSSGFSNISEATTEEPPQFVDRTAIQEAAVAGTVSGTLIGTTANDSSTEIIIEQTSGGRPNKRYSYLEHKWIFQVQPGTIVSFLANAWTDAAAQGDTLVFSYSTDDETYTDMFAVSADYDDDSYQLYPLPSNFSGTVYIRVADVIRTPGAYDKSAIYIDHLFIRIDNVPGSLPVAPSDLAATEATFESITLSWTDNADNELGFYIERSPDGVNWEQVGTTGPDAATFTDTGLPPDVSFYYQVQAFNSSGFSSFSNIISTSTTQTDSLYVAGLSSYTELNRNRWDAFVVIMVRDKKDVPIVGSPVEGIWDTGKTITCVTDSAGQCTVSNTRLKTSIASTSFSITALTKKGYVYDPASNVQNSIVVNRP